MTHRVRLKGAQRTRGKHRKKPVERRLPWEETVTAKEKAEEKPS